MALTVGLMDAISADEISSCRWNGICWMRQKIRLRCK